jgi:hypothetical protein
MGKPQTAASNKYHKDKYDRLYPFVPKGRKSEIQAAADTIGETLNEFIVTAIDERMERMGQVKEPFTPPPGELCESCEKLGEMKPAAQAGNPPEDWKPICGLYVCELNVSEGNIRKCVECIRDTKQNPPE